VGGDGEGEGGREGEGGGGEGEGEEGEGEGEGGDEAAGGDTSHTVSQVGLSNMAHGRIDAFRGSGSSPLSQMGTGTLAHDRMRRCIDVEAHREPLASSKCTNAGQKLADRCRSVGMVGDVQLTPQPTRHCSRSMGGRRAIISVRGTDMCRSYLEVIEEKASLRMKMPCQRTDREQGG
jgi:hypothetical protein